MGLCATVGGGGTSGRSWHVFPTLVTFLHRAGTLASTLCLHLVRLLPRGKSHPLVVTPSRSPPLPLGLPPDIVGPRSSFPFSSSTFSYLHLLLPHFSFLPPAPVALLAARLAAVSGGRGFFTTPFTSSNSSFESEALLLLFGTN